MSESLVSKDPQEIFEIAERAPLPHTALGRLAVRDVINDTEVVWYRAAEPGYPGNFSRDSLTTAFLLGDTEMLHDQIVYSAHYQGTKHDAYTGEEPGKIHHELLKTEDGEVAGMLMDSTLSSAYNACDTTAQFLQGIVYLAGERGPQVLGQYAENIKAAVGYITSHIEDNIFYEKPMHGEDDKTFGLKVTYWKDSCLNTPDKHVPTYPIAYSLAHFQNADALRSVGQALSQPELVMLGNSMIMAGIERFWRNDHFVVAIDGRGDQAEVIDAPSSDSLHALLYIKSDILPEGYAHSITRYMRQLETDAGYRTGLPQQTADLYHTDHVWTHEQALLHAAAQMHGMEEAQEITERVVEYYGDDNPELIHAETYEHGLNKLQLWSYAAFVYLQNPDSSFLKRETKA